MREVGTGALVHRQGLLGHECAILSQTRPRSEECRAAWHELTVRQFTDGAGA